MATTELTDLPLELLSKIVEFTGVEDWFALILTARHFYRLLGNTSIAFSISLRSKDKLKRRLLMAGAARQLADWAVTSDENRQILNDTIRKGPSILFELCTSIAEMRVSDFRALHQANEEIIGPLVETLIKDCGSGNEERWRTFLERKAGEQDGWVCQDPRLALYNYWTYCELFHHSIDDRYGDATTALTVKPLDNNTRHLWLRRCVPDHMVLPKADPRMRELQDLERLTRSHGFWFAAQKELGDVPGLERTMKICDFEILVGHQGLNSMKLALPDRDKSDFHDLLFRLHSKIAATDEEEFCKVPEWGFMDDYSYMESEDDFDNDDRPKCSWYDLQSDCHKVMYKM